VHEKKEDSLLINGLKSTKKIIMQNHRVSTNLHHNKCLILATTEAPDKRKSKWEKLQCSRFFSEYLFL